MLPSVQTCMDATGGRLTGLPLTGTVTNRLTGLVPGPTRRNTDHAHERAPAFPRPVDAGDLAAVGYQRPRLRPADPLAAELCAGREPLSNHGCALSRVHFLSRFRTRADRGDMVARTAGWRVAPDS